MNRPLKADLIAGICAIVAVGAIEAAFANTENDFFQFCTTKAYGWPAPWRIDYCECEGGETIYPALNAMINIGLILASGFVVFAASTWLPHRRHRTPNILAEQVAAADGHKPSNFNPNHDTLTPRQG